MTNVLSMDQALIEKLTNILEVNLDKEHFGVKELAREAGLSRSQLHRKLKSLKNKTASRFIREFRLEKAMVMLQNNEATASEIAYRVGFSSPTYFNTCFHDYYGYPPGEVKFMNLKDTEDNRILENLELVEDSQAEPEILPVKKGRIRKRMVWVNTFLILLLTAVSYSLYKNYKNSSAGEIAFKEKRDKSIAILPFKNLSEDAENQYFADGVSGAIQNNLSKISELMVIPSTSMEKYRNTDLSATEIANEVNVIYLLEGSVQKHGDSIRVIANLVDAKSHEQLHSFVFDWEYKNIFEIQSKIALEIAKQLDLTIAPEKIETIKKHPTENLDAYKMYLKGRFFWHRRTEEDLSKSIYFFNKALELDSTYALAYAGLADAYYIMAWWEWVPKKEGFTKGKNYAQKALSIDNTISEAHSTLGAIAIWYEWNWEDAEKELKLAISINPNSATAHQYYSELLDILGKNKEARAHMNTSLELNPFSIAAKDWSALYYYNTGKYINSIDEYKLALDLADGNGRVIWKNNLRIIQCYLHLGNNKVTIESIKEFISTDSTIDISVLDEMFQYSGIEGVINWFINWILVVDKPEKHPYEIDIARFYAIIGDSQNALEYVEKAFENGNPELLIINNNQVFSTLRSEPRFLALLEKMNLVDYN